MNSPKTNHGTFLDLSTAHLSPDSIAWLTAIGRDNEKANRKNDESRTGTISTLGTTAYGWFMAVPAIDSPAVGDTPADLVILLGIARVMGYHYILFDRDAPTHPALTIYDDVGNSIDGDDGAGLADEIDDEGRASLSDAAVESLPPKDALDAMRANPPTKHELVDAEKLAYVRMVVRAAAKNLTLAAELLDAQAR